MIEKKVSKSLSEQYKLWSVFFLDCIPLTIVPFPIDVLESQTQQILLGMIFLCIAPVSGDKDRMTIVPEQSVLTLSYSSG